MRFVPAALLVALVVSGCAGSRTAAPPGCDALVFDLRAGTLNGLSPTASMDAVKAQFPCFTGESAEGEAFNFGGGVFFLDHGFFAYTFRDFLEARLNFDGQTVPVVLGEPLRVVEAAFGATARVDETANLFDTRYGCLRAEVGADGTVREVGVHAESCATLDVPR